jgi:hypothetical protein
MHWYLKIIITVNIGINNIHSKWIRLIFLKILFIKYNVTILFIL